MAAQPEQPPKQAPYYQSTNPISQTPLEQQNQNPPQRQRGDPVPMNRRTVNSDPSNDETLARRREQKQQEQIRKQGKQDVDLEYGVELQPAEGSIAEAVEHKGTRSRTQAGAHAGPVGSAYGPGYSGFGEERNHASDLGRKKEEHDRVLGDRIGQSPSEPDGEMVRQQKLKLDEQLDVKDTVQEATSDPVVGR